MPQTRTANFLSHFQEGLAEAAELDIAVAFITKSGLEDTGLRGGVEARLANGVRLKLLVDLTTGTTDPSALWQLLALQDRYPGLVEMRTLIAPDSPILHTKLYIFKSAEKSRILTGSANWSGPGFLQNIEHGLVALGPKSDPVIADAERLFHDLWNSARARPLDDEAIRLYENYCGRLRVVSNRAERLARSALRRLSDHLLAAPPALTWPGIHLAYILGLVTARGEFSDATKTAKIELRYGVGLYKNNELRVENVGFPVSDVIPTIPEQVVQRLQQLLPSASVSVSPTPPALSPRYTITVDLSGDPATYSQIRAPLQPWPNCYTFRLPRGLATADLPIVVEFLKGFALACGLLTDGTSLPAKRVTGLPGLKVVWLRPKSENKRLFSQLQDLIETRLGFTVYRQIREYREPHLKIRCQDFQQIGFGISWWDELVEEGARYNEEVVLGTSGSS